MSTPRTGEHEWYSGDNFLHTLWVVSSDFARELERENNELRELVNLITIQEESDSGRIFYPNGITSCRAMDGERMGQITEKYRKTPHIDHDTLS